MVLPASGEAVGIEMLRACAARSAPNFGHERGLENDLARIGRVDLALPLLGAPRHHKVERAPGWQVPANPLKQVASQYELLGLWLDLVNLRSAHNHRHPLMLGVLGPRRLAERVHQQPRSPRRVDLGRRDLLWEPAAGHLHGGIVRHFLGLFDGLA